MDWCVPWKVTNGVEKRVLQVLQYQKIGVCCELPGRTGISPYRLNEHSVEDEFNVKV
jgi:hypothetical protein